MKCNKCKNNIDKGKEKYFEGKIICSNCWKRIKEPEHIYTFEKRLNLVK